MTKSEPVAPPCSGATKPRRVNKDAAGLAIAALCIDPTDARKAVEENAVRLVVIVSGPIAVGKSAFIGEIVKRFNAIRISTRELIQSLRQVPSERRALQEAGEALDRETDGRWVADALTTRAAALDDDAIVIVDSVRIAKQVEHLRTAYVDRIWHVHLTASQEVLSKRYMSRKEKGDPAVSEFATYDEARKNTTEADIDSLGKISDECICTDDLDASAVAALAAQVLKTHLGL